MRWLLAIALVTACTRAGGRPHTISWRRGGLGTWGSAVTGVMFTVDVDLDALSITAANPDGKPGTRTLSAGEARELRELAVATRAEPETPLGNATDYAEDLRISDGSSTFAIHSSAPITRPAAAALTKALDTAARWPPEPR